MTGALAVLQVGLALVLLAAAGGKLVRPEELAAVMRLSHLPTPLARILSPVIISLEVIVGAGLLLARAGLLTAVFAAATILFAAFTAWVVWVRARGLEIRCSCFGAGGKNITTVTVVRNALLLTAAFAGIMFATSETTPLPAVTTYWVLTVAAIVAVALLGAALNQVRGQLVLSLDSVQHRRNMRADVRT